MSELLRLYTGELGEVGLSPFLVSSVTSQISTCDIQVPVGNVMRGQ